MLSHTTTLRDVYGVETPSQVISLFLSAEDKEKWESTDEFRPTDRGEIWVYEEYGIMAHACQYPHLVLRRKKITRWRLAPGEQPRIGLPGDIVACDGGETHIVTEEQGRTFYPQWILEKYEEKVP